MQQPQLSVIIPAYNEAARIRPTLEKIVQYLEGRKIPYEIIVVDDGSADATAAVVRALADRNEAVRLISLPQNQGKGSAVKKGVLNSWGEIIYFTDADLSTPIEEIEKFLPQFPVHDIVIGSRGDGADVRVHEPLYRELLGKLFNRFVRLLCVPGIQDTQCGAKMFKKDVAHRIFPQVKTSRFAFDVEVLYIALDYGYKIKEVPVRWYYSANTTVRTFSDGPKMLWDLLHMWFRRNF